MQLVNTISIHVKTTALMTLVTMTWLTLGRGGLA